MEHFVDIEISEQDSIAILQITGRMTMQTSHTLLNAIKDCLGKNVTRILVDMGQVEYMDSSGVGVLISSFKNARKQDIPLGMIHLSPRVQTVMEMSGLSSLLPVFPDLETAKAKLS